MLSEAAYARRLNVSRQIVNRWVKQGRIPLHGTKIDPEEADRLMAGHRHPAHDGRRKARIPGIECSREQEMVSTPWAALPDLEKANLTLFAHIVFEERL